MDLMEFVTARLDDTEAAARAVRPLGHVFDMGGTRLDEKFSHGRVRFASEDGRSCIEGDAAAARHFGRHDPARVLREVAAGRAILGEHAATDWTAYGDHMCRRCVLDDDEPHDELHHWLPVPCPTVRALAAVWSDHPDYDPAWAPPG